jgi:hypothetical protein
LQVQKWMNSVWGILFTLHSITEFQFYRLNFLLLLSSNRRAAKKRGSSHSGRPCRFWQPVQWHHELDEEWVVSCPREVWPLIEWVITYYRPAGDERWAFQCLWGTNRRTVKRVGISRETVCLYKIANRLVIFSSFFLFSPVLLCIR